MKGDESFSDYKDKDDFSEIQSDNLRRQENSRDILISK